MSGRTHTRPAPRPPAKSEISLTEVRKLLATTPRALEPYEEAKVIYAFTWAAVRPTPAGFATIDAAATADEARAIARRHPGAVAVFRGLRLVRIEDVF